MLEYNGGFAFTAPSAVTPELDKMVYDGGYQKQLKLNQQALAQQKQADLEKQRELDRQAKATKFVGDKLDPAKYDTLDAPSNHLIEGKLSDIQKEFSQKIHDNPNMDEADLEGQMQDRIGKLSQYARSVKNMKQGIDAATTAYAKNEPGIDTESLKIGAMKRFLYNPDGTLNENPDLTQNHVDEELKEHPELYVKGDVPIMKSIEQYKPQKQNSNSTSEFAGTTVEDKFKGELYPWNHIQKDAKGNVTGIGVNSGTAQLNGQNVPVVDDDTFQKLMNNGVAANLKRDTDAYIKAKGLNIPDGSEQYKIIGKNILYKKLQDLTPTGQDIEHKKTNANFVDKQQAGIGSVLGAVESRAEKKKDEQLSGSNYGRLVDAVNGDPKILDAGTAKNITTADGKNHALVDVTDAVGGFSTNQDTKLPNGQDYSKIVALYADRDHPGKLYVQERNDPGDATYDPSQDNGHLKVLNSKEVVNMMRRHGPENGFAKNSNEIDRLLKLKPIKEQAAKTESVSEKRERLAKEELEKRKANAIPTTLPTPVQ